MLRPTHTLVTTQAASVELATLKVNVAVLEEHMAAIKNRDPYSLAFFLKDWWKKVVGPLKARITCRELVDLLVAWLIKNG